MFPLFFQFICFIFHCIIFIVNFKINFCIPVSYCNCHEIFIMNISLINTRTIFSDQSLHFINLRVIIRPRFYFFFSCMIQFFSFCHEIILIQFLSSFIFLPTCFSVIKIFRYSKNRCQYCSQSCHDNKSTHFHYKTTDNCYCCH